MEYITEHYDAVCGTMAKDLADASLCRGRTSSLDPELWIAFGAVQAVISEQSKATEQALQKRSTAMAAAQRKRKALSHLLDTLRDQPRRSHREIGALVAECAAAKGNHSEAVLVAAINVATIYSELNTLGQLDTNQIVIGLNTYGLNKPRALDLEGDVQYQKTRE
ncbi:MAG: hypothetical protein ABJH63_12515 [Rhizobiaceae bacterium]